MNTLAPKYTPGPLISYFRTGVLRNVFLLQILVPQIFPTESKRDAKTKIVRKIKIAYLNFLKVGIQVCNHLKFVS